MPCQLRPAARHCHVKSSLLSTEVPADQQVGWLFLDLNSYFASVEQQENPQLRGKPIAVAAVLSDTSCAIAASYEAKAFGVKTGTNLGEAKAKCPGLKIVEANHESYVRYHHRILEEVDCHIPVHQVAFIDEMSCQLTGRQCDPAHAQALAMQIKAGMAERIGEVITCSIGLGPNRFLAKVATDMEKPDGLVTIRPCDLPDILRELKLRDLPGIGANIETRLLASRIASVWDLYHTGPKRVRAAWGSVEGERFWMKLHGEEIPDEPVQHRSIGHSHVLAPEMRPPDQAAVIARRLLLKAASRLRRMEYRATGMHLSIRLEAGARAEVHCGLPPVNDSFVLLEIMLGLWSQLLPSAAGRRIKKVSVTLSGLQSGAEDQPELFGQMPDDHRADRQRRDRLSSVMDELNQKYGRDTISLGIAKTQTQHFSGTKIAFNRIPDAEEFRE